MEGVERVGGVSPRHARYERGASGMERRESGQVVHLVIDDHPVAVGRGVPRHLLSSVHRRHRGRERREGLGANESELPERRVSARFFSPTGGRGKRTIRVSPMPIATRGFVSRETSSTRASRVARAARISPRFITRACYVSEYKARRTQLPVIHGRLSHATPPAPAPSAWAPARAQARAGRSCWRRRRRTRARAAAPPRR